MHTNKIYAVVSSCKIVVLSLKDTGVLGLQESLGSGYTEKLENANPKGSSTRKQTRGTPVCFIV